MFSANFLKAFQELGCGKIMIRSKYTKNDTSQEKDRNVLAAL